MKSLTIAEVGSMFGLKLPAAPGKAKCPLREHKKKLEKTFRVYRADDTNCEIWKCWSCDPPANKGGAIDLYARLANVERKVAWKQLGDMGFDVPGWVERGAPGGARRLPPLKLHVRNGQTVHGVRGTAPPKVLSLNPTTYAGWAALDTGALAKLAPTRGMTAEFMRQHGAVDMPGGKHVGLTYRDADTGEPLRVRVRGVEKKAFWTEPRTRKEEPDRRPLASLYLADELRPLGISIEPAIVVEGELDALSVLYAGVPNVVSLPDGFASAKTVSLEPLYGRFNVWMVATDAGEGEEEKGEAAYRFLKDRASLIGADCVRVYWRRFENDEVVTYKDANDALRAGFTGSEFRACLDVAYERAYGRRVFTPAKTG